MGAKLHNSLVAKFKASRRQTGAMPAHPTLIPRIDPSSALTNTASDKQAMAKQFTKGHRMGQVDELEQRISAAFARISAGVEALSAERPVPAPAAPEADPAALTALQTALEDERMTSAQLTERLRAVSDQRAASEAGLRSEVEALTRHLDSQGLDVQRLSSSVAQLREDLRRLREAAEQGVVDPTLINRAMLAELEALRATRAAEANEMNDIMSALGPILEAEEARANA